MSYPRMDQAAITRTLAGKVATVLLVSEGEDTLFIVTDAGTMELGTEADCCSETWWADVVGVKQLIGFPIRTFEEIEMPQVEDGRSRQECDQIYGCRITTSGGVCDLIFRNSSNGYYGGGYIPTWKPLRQVRPITEDWSA
jgi:hypothetical protein